MHNVKRDKVIKEIKDFGSDPKRKEPVMKKFFKNVWKNYEEYFEKYGQYMNRM